MARNLFFKFAAVSLINLIWVMTSLELSKRLEIGGPFSLIALYLLPSNVLISIFFHRRSWRLGLLLAFMITFSSFQFAQVFTDLLGYPGSDPYGIHSAIVAYVSASAILWILSTALLKPLIMVKLVSQNKLPEA
jgi:hypothetical protein